MSDFLAMGGYAGFVWPAFGLTALVMVWLLVASLRRLRANESLLAQTGRARPARRRAGAAEDGNEATP